MYDIKQTASIRALEPRLDHSTRSTRNRNRNHNHNWRTPSVLQPTIVSTPARGEHKTWYCKLYSNCCGGRGPTTESVTHWTLVCYGNLTSIETDSGTSSPTPLPTKNITIFGAPTAHSHVTGKVSADVAKQGLGLVEDRVYLVLLSPPAGGLPPLQRVCLVTAERPHVARRHLLLQGCGGSTVHRLRGLVCCDVSIVAVLVVLMFESCEVCSLYNIRLVLDCSKHYAV